MNTSAVTVQMDSELIEKTERTLNEIGLTMSSAFTVFAKAVVRTGSIPFDLTIDPFYKEEHQNELNRRIELYETGKTSGAQVTKTIQELEAMANG